MGSIDHLKIQYLETILLKKKFSIIILAYYCVILSSYVPEVVRSHKPLVTDRAYEVFLSCVRPCVSG